MNSFFSSAAEDLIADFKKKINDEFKRLQNDPQFKKSFSNEAILKLAMENDFNDQKTVKALFDLFIQAIHLEPFK